MSFEFWFNVSCYILSYVFITYCSGRLVMRGVRVNYTRKINHFVMFLTPFIVEGMMPYHRTPQTGLIYMVMVIGSILILIKPVRSRFEFVRIMFSSFDRPEDRPHTLKWLMTQIFGVFTVIIGLSLYLQDDQRESLLLIPIFINAFGDGFAEPVGVRFGKHPYKTRALFTKKTYIRTLEGSAVVWIFGVLTILLVHDLFTMQQFIVALVTIPILTTLTEALAPHTWDTPFIFLVGGTTPILILQFI